MNRMWAPWRKAYVTRKKGGKGCVFCLALKSRNDKDNLVVARSRHSFSILNLYPYHNGHTLVVPNRHVSDLDQLSAPELGDLMSSLIQTKKRLGEKMKPQGYNVGINIGKAAGAGIAGHLHIHIIPRWFGDHNFMPVIGQTKIISDSLESLYHELTSNDPKISGRKRK